MFARLLYLASLMAASASAQWLTVDQHYPAPALSREMLGAHNQIRARVNVQPLTWSASLAARAQDWAGQLLQQGRFYHRPNSNCGENIFEIFGGHASASEVVGDWASEAPKYNYPANTCRGRCGHYTQVVWRGTRELGCAVASKNGREVWVCNYYPPGNWVGERPY
jgi:pathogenesis-related protein 1